MKATFLGHQSWLITAGDTNILIDPVLCNSFGGDNDQAIEIYPPRIVAIDKMPKIDAIILSHEHSDHFHIPTLIHFKDTPILVSSLMVNCVIDIMKVSGLITKTIPFQVITQIGNLEIILYPADQQTVFWESRVSQIYIRSREDNEKSIFIAVDALISNDFKEDVENEALAIPQVIAVSNNSQIPPKGVLGSLDNCKDYSPKNKIIGISILKELLISYLDGLEGVSNIIICGGGFTKKYDTYFGAYPMSDQDKLAEIANYYSVNRQIFGPLPGQVIIIDSDIKYTNSVDWIELDQNRLDKIHLAGRQFQESSISVDIKPLISEEIIYPTALLKTELNKFAKAFMLSELGQIAIDFIASKTFDILPYGLLLKLRPYNNIDNTEYYVLDLNKAEFTILGTDNINEDMIPFGAELYLNDFIGVISGQIQIWDLGGIGIKSWYIGEATNSPVALMYSYFGEQIRPNQNYLSLKKRWVREIIS